MDATVAVAMAAPLDAVVDVVAAAVEVAALGKDQTASDHLEFHSWF